MRGSDHAPRIGSGDMRGRKLRTPAGTGTRPLLGRIKKSLFDILAPRLPGARVLDVYAGSGSFGLEALSRGAAEAVLVESDRTAAGVIRDNIAKLGLRGHAHVAQQDARSAMSALAGGGHEFDLVFLDPPFRMDAAGELLACAVPLVASGGLVILRVARGRRLPESGAGVTLEREKKYGASKVGFYVCEKK